MKIKKIILLSALVSTMLYAENTTMMQEVNIVERVNSKHVKDISNEDLKSADLAEALMKSSPNISIVRRNGIANDIILRGQKKDNINILIDNAKIYGACPNRMDPATSHTLTNNIKSVKIIEGPYDVENFGTLSGLVKVETKDPEEGVNAELNLNTGSFGYKKASTTISGGNSFIKALISASIEEGKAYKDGNGDNFLKQQEKKGVLNANQYYKDDMKAFKKKSVLSKLQFNLTDDQDLKLSYTANRSDKVLYPTGPMDADFDDSDIYTLGYTIRELGAFSKELNLEYYYSKVDHPMSTRYRNNGRKTYSKNHMESSIWGTTIKNSLNIADSLVTLGLDTSVRNWKGQRSMTNKETGIKTNGMKSLYSTDTKNRAIFTKIEKSLGSFDLETGLRYDYTDIETEKSNTSDNKYVALSAYIFGAYNFDEQSRVFLGIGKSSRVPDARELYMGDTSNSSLEDTKNYEIDLGFDKTIGDFNIKSKVFYSKLKDYIYNSSFTNNTTRFENIDASIYGIDVSGYYFMNDNFSLDFGLAYQRGKKDKSYNGKDKDLAEIPPFKTNLALNFEYETSKLRAEVIASSKWNKYDKSAKEQELAGYMVANLKYSQELFKYFELTLGVDNVFDKAYSSTNTYQDITYIESGGDRILLNDAGRYFYMNLKYSF